MKQKNVIFHRKSCRLCNGTEHDLILRLAPSPIADAYVLPSEKDKTQESYPMDLYLCKKCGHAQLLDVIDPNVLYRDYIYVTTSSMGLSDHFKGYAARVLQKINPDKNALIMDIGSNDGTLLGHFKAHGYKVLGVEPATDIARKATESGVETVPEFFTSGLGDQLRKSHGAAQIITMNNLFANIDDLQSTADGIRKLLAPNGVFIFETFYFVDYLENMVFDFMYHEHLSYNTIKPLARFFKSHGMELIDVERVPTKGGSVRCTVQPEGGPRPKSPNVAEHIAYEEKIGIHQPGALFKAFEKRVNAEKQKLLAQLTQLKKEGKKIAGYGASATSTTLMYHFGLTGLLDFLIDENPAKQNTFSPGCHLPVLPPNAIRERKPDAIVVLAWRYFEPIRKKNEDFLKSGGTFLVPLPEFRRV